MEPKTMITEQDYQAIIAKRDDLKTWLDTSPCVTRSHNGTLSYPSDTLPQHCHISNDERSAVEVYEFIRDRPHTYFAYTTPATAIPQSVTTWTGEKLGTVIAHGTPYISSWGDTRQQLTIIPAINGLTYSATAYFGRGNVPLRSISCRMHVKKGI